MNSLTDEQLKKIEENKRAAILKKQKHLQSQNSDSKIIVAASHVEPQKPPAFSTNVSSVTATCRLLPENRFIVDMTYHSASIEIFKSINGRKYDSFQKKWTFPVSEHANLVKKLESLKPHVSVSGLPTAIVESFKYNSEQDLSEIDVSNIDDNLLKTLMPFQIEGIRFGISKKGRCLIADDMGLGKTIQALGIASYYKQNWPLLIICPSSMRFPWEEAIQNFLPSVNPFYISVMTSSKDIINEATIVIISYDLMKTCLATLQKKHFGFVIVDESHFLKSYKSVRTKAALELIKKTKHVVLLSGTPALSRPQELYTQIYAIEPRAFRTFHEFGIRYCNGKKERFGWNYNGSSNMEELDLYLRKKIMIRRLKSQVIDQLPAKLRKVVILNPIMVKNVSKLLSEYANKLEVQKGMERRGTLLSYYCATGNAKLKAVCEYIQDKLECENKFIVFGHHNQVLNGICDLLIEKHVEFIRIDGSTNSETRKLYCDQFQNEEKYKVAVLSIKAANSGLTLTAAQLVIFAELYWNPGELTQAEDRAHRIGQQDRVVVEYLVAKGTADEHLWNLIQSKLDVLNKVGLSKDNFKNADTEHLSNSKQQTLTALFQSMQEQSYTDSEAEKFESEYNFTDISVDDEVDNLLANVNFDEMDDEFMIESKKRKVEN